jgi:hypothetical protein
MQLPKHGKKVTELKSKIKVHLLKVCPTLLSTEFFPATGNGYAAMISANVSFARTG